MTLGKGIALGPIAEAILASVVAHFDAAPGIELPTRRFIAPGSPRMIAWDCDGVAVTHSSIALGQAPGVNAGPYRTGSPAVGMALRSATFTVQIVMCVPEPKDPTKPVPVADLTKAGLQLMRAAGLLSQALADLGHPVRQAIGGGGSITAGAVEVLGPLGGLACVEASLTCTVGLLA